jgi:hypothetical protein
LSRLFIIGSGPSLRQTPVNDLAGEDLFVMNKWNRIARELDFRVKPKYYLKIDYNSYDHLSWKEEIDWAKNNCEKLFLWEQFRTGYKIGHANYEHMPDGVGNLDGVNVQWINKCKHTTYHWDNWRRANSWHLPALCTAFGGMSAMIQIAAMEYDEIYLLGCDLGYTPDRTQNHAIPDYTLDESNKVVMDNGNMQALHEMARRCSPVPIYNATVGGFLETYPRVNIFELLEERRAHAQP